MYYSFVELPSFSAIREQYMDDDAFRQFQDILRSNPEAGDVIMGTGGLRKVRMLDKKRQKGKRGGLRVIYYFLTAEGEFLLFTLYDKDDQDDMSPTVKKIMRGLLADIIKLRSAKRWNAILRKKLLTA